MLGALSEPVEPFGETAPWPRPRPLAAARGPTQGGDLANGGVSSPWLQTTLMLMSSAGVTLAWGPMTVLGILVEPATNPAAGQRPMVKKVPLALCWSGGSHHVEEALLVEYCALGVACYTG